VTREGVGTGRAVSETGIKKAEHDALKRAAVKFGIARELYKREFDSIEQEESGSQPRSVDLLALTMGDLITGKQLGMIRGLAREAGLDADEESRRVMKCGLSELSKRGASDLIEHLRDIQSDRSAAVRRAG
jgi:hypothetical protein